MTTTPIVLRAAGTALVLGRAADGLPYVAHWGADLGPLTAEAARGLVEAGGPPVPHNAPDDPGRLTLLPGEAEGWRGHPGLSGHRDGAVAYPRWRVGAVTVTALDGGGAPPGPAHGAAADGGRVLVAAADPDLGLAVELEVRLERSGLLRLRHAVTNTGDGPWTLDGLYACMPLPPEATELLDLSGRWCRERVPQRQPFGYGTRLRASRRGRTGHDAPLLLVAGGAGFGFRAGEVWGVHVAWSGDHVHLAERLPEEAAQAASVLVGGELVRPGEIRLPTGATYRTPWVCFAWSGSGLDGLSARVHAWLRARPGHPRTPRPVVLNTWEAVYFDHDLDRLCGLADVAARVGVERFVLDDGWFAHRRHDRAGLGDWTVDPEVWPDGLRPLFRHVRGLGMQVGLWVEPEMVNPDSDLARAHPDWLLAAPGRAPREWRHQLVLDLARPEVAEHLLGRLDALVGEYRLDYLKWDHNRDLLEAVHGPTGGAGVHRQTAALYRLLAELRRRHPALEIESCASGGGRVDLGILAHTDRVWASDTNDALERQAIQRWTGLLLPPELVGSHVGGPVAHTTGRAAPLAFRCATSLFGHAGIEWDITACTEEELRTLTAWTALYRELRPLLHTGTTVRADLPDPGAWLHGVVAPDGSAAVYCYARSATSTAAYPGRVRLPGLDPARDYRVRPRLEAGEPRYGHVRPPAWLRAGAAVLSGAALERAGLQMPVLYPDNALLLHATEV
ncbi:alpha-galactosidase [Marinitenerispora sediminis]|uniref:Alpha-galactosidase n=1 Tax=Marinitenerispora sediminis TaxID=1931232 RepID=A0A368T9Y8_9ACTN|nr:alpha-galactosidase [Marinitenerispora sediminis]RCV54112.1 alpha-galactosidase [Marinitenerispora sediminis]RCV56857.1 alpha-galactosidase [Marinitenerispora sediminis]RCV61565.1 alpha-galactosidase [Marinitenerispora sediminis]